MNEMDKQPMQDQAEKLEELDVAELMPTSSRHFGRTTSTSNSVVTVVNTERNGKRLAIANKLLARIGVTDQLQVAFSKKGLVIGTEVDADNNYFTLRDDTSSAARKKANVTSASEDIDNETGKRILYNSDLVKEITHFFNLDFTGITSLSFSEVKYVRINGKIAALVLIAPREPDATTPEAAGADVQGAEYDPSTNDAD